MKLFKKCVSITSILTLFILTSCGGRTPHPVQVIQYGDDSKSCKELKFEIMQVQAQLNKLLPEKDKLGKNVALGAAGFFLLVPWFFMDFKNAEAIEYEAYRQRYDHLSSIAFAKECSIEKKEYLSIEEMKKKYEDAQKEKK